ncbi:MCP four helix bundle domain-containing protein, partial [Oxalicibacterium faecigallinarum]|uniref:MCP four helix bundle domain-containing protein n=1 Tax=Oxalicibacterium faecigallinarum TaxID=573741 RepID=UPI001669C023
MKNLKIGQRLALSFGCVVAILIVLAVIAFTRITLLDDGISTLIDNRYPKTVQAHTIKDSLNETARSMRNALLMTNRDQVRAELDNINRLSGIIGPTIDALDKTIAIPQARTYMNGLLESRAKFVPLKDRFVTLVQGGLLEEAAQLMFEELRPAQLVYMENLDKLVGVQSDLMIKAGEQAHGDAANAKQMLIGLSIAAVLLSILFGVFATRSITRPLNEAVNLAEKVASGDLTGDIVVNSRDETGQLLQALKNMNESLVRIVSQVRTGTDTIATASTQIATGNLDLSSRTEEQASSLEETASSMEELTSTVKQNADNARQSNQLAMTASEVAVQGGSVVSQVVETMGSIKESANKIVDIIGV